MPWVRSGGFRGGPSQPRIHCEKHPEFGCPNSPLLFCLYSQVYINLGQATRVALHTSCFSWSCIVSLLPDAFLLPNPSPPPEPSPDPSVPPRIPPRADPPSLRPSGAPIIHHGFTMAPTSRHKELRHVTRIPPQRRRAPRDAALPQRRYQDARTPGVAHPV